MRRSGALLGRAPNSSGVIKRAALPTSSTRRPSTARSSRGIRWLCTTCEQGQQSDRCRDAPRSNCPHSTPGATVAEHAPNEHRCFCWHVARALPADATGRSQKVYCRSMSENPLKSRITPRKSRSGFRISRPSIGSHNGVYQSRPGRKCRAQQFAQRASRVG
jgi:hypothetical protein